MRASFVAAVAVLALTAPAFAAALTPNEIQMTFFNGQPFTASATNIKYKMIFSADGKMNREPIGGGGSKCEGTWKLTKEASAPPGKAPSPIAFASSPPATTNGRW
jgi:hypothetical protein